MRTDDFFYELPKELIAQEPLKDRSSSRLLRLGRESGQIEHGRFTDVLKYLKSGDVLVINDTKVLPARLLGVKAETGAHAELLILKRAEGDVFECLAKPGKRLKEGAVIYFGGEDESAPLKALILEELPEGLRRVRFYYEGIFEEVLDSLGEMPLPPYIKKKLEEKDRYNTVYARNAGSAAAPTAGLHFTKELLENAKAMGVTVAPVTLHVGLGTFRPVKAENIEDHHMHSEFYIVPEETAAAVNAAKDEGRRVICVGTTACRTVESAAEETESGFRLKAGSGWTEIFIYPGYEFKIMEGLITNFHLPESTLLMLVSAFAGKEHVMAAYEEAVRERYRFFSFGDAMLII